MASLPKFGPWRYEDHQSFLALATEPPPPSSNYVTLSGLASLNKAPFTGEQQTLKVLEFVEEAWSLRLKHPVYKWLRRNKDFNEAWHAFQTIKKRPAGQPDPLKLASPTVDLVFLQQFVQYAGWSFLIIKHPVTRDYGANAERRHAAIKHARKLSQLLTKGIFLNSYSDTRKLQLLLETLVTELEATTRKRYGGERESIRNNLKMFARDLISECGLRSPAVVSSLARMVSAPCTLKTAGRYCAEQERNWRRQLTIALANALLSRADKNTGISG